MVLLRVMSPDGGVVVETNSDATALVADLRVQVAEAMGTLTPLVQLALAGRSLLDDEEIAGLVGFEDQALHVQALPLEEPKCEEAPYDEGKVVLSPVAEAARLAGLLRHDCLVVRAGACRRLATMGTAGLLHLGEIAVCWELPPDHSCSCCSTCAARAALVEAAEEALNSLGRLGAMLLVGQGLTRGEFDKAVQALMDPSTVNLEEEEDTSVEGFREDLSQLEMFFERRFAAAAA